MLLFLISFIFCGVDILCEPLRLLLLHFLLIFRADFEMVLVVGKGYVCSILVRTHNTVLDIRAVQTTKLWVFHYLELAESFLSYHIVFAYFKRLNRKNSLLKLWFLLWLLWGRFNLLVGGYWLHFILLNY